MQRLITNFLEEWKNRKSRKPLIIQGARQVGKTYSVEYFGNENFTNTVKINLEEKPELRKIFTKNNTHEIINELSVVINVNIIPGETLLFIDEIQSCPEAIVTLRYFYEQIPDLHVIGTGSLLGHTLNDLNYSMPVGRVEFCYMYPMNFKEFLWALNEKRLIDYIENYTFKNIFIETIHLKLLKYLRLYFFIGGMPEAVKFYISDKNFTETERIHNNILTFLQYDFSKYGSKKEQEYLVKTLNYSAINIGKKVKYINIDKNIRSTYLKEAFRKLERSRIVHLIRHTKAREIPVKEYLNENIYKVLFLDIGLSNHICNIRLINIEELITKNEGALAEQFIGQELLLLSKPYIDSELYYWMREAKNANAEIDYLWQYNNQIFPIEVKAGKRGTLKSLQIFLLEKQIKTGIRFNLDLPSIGSFKAKISLAKQINEIEYQLISIPLYMSFALPQIMEKIIN